MLQKRRPTLRTACLLAVLLGLASVRAEVQTLTDKQGRSIKADVLSIENEKVKIKRDDGQIFDLPLATLDATTQQGLQAWSAKAASQIPADAITLDLSRGIFDSSKREDIGITTIEEKWGYSVTVSNHSPKIINNLKFEYVLFVKPDKEPGKDEIVSKLKRSTGTNTLAELKGKSQSVFRTDSIKIYKQKLQPGYYWTKTGKSEMIRDTLIGIWIKAYVGDQIVAEACLPESLSKTEKGP